MEQEDEARRLQERNGDREVTGPLRGLPLPDGSLFLPLLELRDHDREDLHDDRRRDVGHDAQREERELRECLTAEQCQEGEDATLLGLLLDRVDRVLIDAGRREVRTQPIDRQHEDREQDLVAKVRHLHDVPDRRPHRALQRKDDQRRHGSRRAGRNDPADSAGGSVRCLAEVPKRRKPPRNEGANLSGGGLGHEGPSGWCGRCRGRPDGRRTACRGPRQFRRRR